ncbi:hypothetical protein CTA2_12272 [Colletotrichum tanaceti]|uniref:Uncharacterized protein n=1 Tax=Colletotrichum tanaceti TaxID=1306861 RepID=A0A4U6X335_9PEZI|nr:hypothetical protein CTA2_12272 [Colletotrichum tanaceti]TKW49788.1 hypothetical protein CTA1_4452 [Colletotrichum tanaceti]
MFGSTDHAGQASYGAIRTPTIPFTTQEAAATAEPEPDLAGLLLFLAMYFCVLFLFFCLATHSIHGCYDHYGAMGGEGRSGRRGGRRRRLRHREAGNSSPVRRGGENPMERGLLDLRGDSPPPAYHTIIITVPPYDDAEEEERERRHSDSVTPPHYVDDLEGGILQTHRSGEVAYMV